MPLLHGAQAIGLIAIRRAEVRPFTDGQVELVKAFADQAVIAIENVRLFTELEEKNKALTTTHAQVTEALEQQTATADILRVISSSPTDIQPVLDAVIRSAARLCEAYDAWIGLREGDNIRVRAHEGPIPVAEELRPIRRGRVSEAAVLDRRPVHVHDLAASGAEFPQGHADALRIGQRTVLGVPLLREGEAIGVILIRRLEVRPFTDRQISLLQTFADQAVIAIENVRLFTETKEALERQTATSEILQVISGSPTDVQPVLETILSRAVELCGARHGSLFRFDGELLHAAAHHDVPAATLEILRRDYPMPPSGGYMSGRAILARRIVTIEDILADELYESTAPHASGLRSMVGVPLLRDGNAVGVIVIVRSDPGPFTDRQIELLKTFADQAVIAIENVRLFTELQARNAALAESLAQQTAAAEILRVISESPTDYQPVFDTIVRNAVGVCAAHDAVLALAEGEDLIIRAQHGPIGAPIGVRYPMRDTVGGLAVSEARLVHVENLAEADQFPAGREMARRAGHRTTLGVPLLRDGVAIGTIMARRAEVRPFTDTQIALLQIFADQAVIAIENVRLFKELESSNRELRVALEQQTATSELLKVIGRSTFDLRPVFDTLAENAVRLCAARLAFIYRFDGQRMRAVASYNVSDDMRAFVEQNPIAPGRHTATARAALERRTIHIHDVRADSEYTYGAKEIETIRTVLVVPMLRAGELLGAIQVYRHEVRPFTDGQIALMETFADQAAIAIENARLLSELRDRTAELTRSIGELKALGEVGRAVSSRWISRRSWTRSWPAQSNFLEPGAGLFTSSMMRPRSFTCGLPTRLKTSWRRLFARSRSVSERAQPAGQRLRGHQSRSRIPSMRRNTLSLGFGAFSRGSVIDRSWRCRCSSSNGCWAPWSSSDGSWEPSRRKS